MTDSAAVPRGRRSSTRRPARDGASSGSARPTDGPVNERERAREIALRILTHSARSSAQLREGLISRDVAPEIADELVARYADVGLLDDAALAATIVRTRHAERGQSRRAIHQELRRKGFDEQDIGTALAQIDEDDERERAAELARRRWAQLSSQPTEARIRRVVAMLGRKGYSSSLAFSLVKDLRGADNGDE
ncbi:regulatory protein RecX [Demequina sp.]|uniref:regulatory protein RecX n=1 Tax=Demequina sp. TaxID=2050685 RepID=UPI0025E95D54|nr:regulatory protein RecX [Demequina sp.]